MNTSLDTPKWLQNFKALFASPCACYHTGAFAIDFSEQHYCFYRPGEIIIKAYCAGYNFSQFTPNEQATFFAHAGSDLEWEVPYGMTYNALSAMMTQAYIDSTGTTIEQIASVQVACNRWAQLQPNALFYGKPLTVESVLESKVVSYPLTSKMCNVLADGGSAWGEGKT